VGLCLVQQLVKRAVVKRPLLEAETGGWCWEIHRVRKGGFGENFLWCG